MLLSNLLLILVAVCESTNFEAGSDATVETIDEDSAETSDFSGKQRAMQIERYKRELDSLLKPYIEKLKDVN
jgi:hypothetical protein